MFWIIACIPFAHHTFLNFFIDQIHFLKKYTIFFFDVVIGLFYGSIPFSLYTWLFVFKVKILDILCISLIFFCENVIIKPQKSAY